MEIEGMTKPRDKAQVAQLFVTRGLMRDLLCLPDHVEIVSMEFDEGGIAKLIIESDRFESVAEGAEVPLAISRLTSHSAKITGELKI